MSESCNQAASIAPIRPGSCAASGADPGRVSAVIPVFNRAHLVGAAIDSVLAQSIPVAEIIVIDDGSTDNTAAVVAGYGDKVRLLRQHNQGPGAARNHGMRSATGDFIAFLDSDDLWPAGKNQLQLEFFARYPDVDFTFGDMANFSGNEAATEPEIKDARIHEYFVANSSNVQHLLECLVIENMIPTPTVMFRRSVMERIGMFDETLKIAEDLDYWLRVARACRCGFVNAVLCRRRRHEGNLINDWVKRTQTLAEVLERVRQVDGLPARVRHALQAKLRDTYYDLGSYFFKRGRFDDALAHLQRGGPAGRTDARWLIKSGMSYLATRIGLAHRSSPANPTLAVNRGRD